MGLSAQGPFRGFVAEGRAGGPRPVIPGSLRPRLMTYPERSSLFVPVEKSLLWWLTWGTPFGPTPQRYRAGRSVALGLIGPFPALSPTDPFRIPLGPFDRPEFRPGRRGAGGRTDARNWPVRELGGRRRWSCCISPSPGPEPARRPARDRWDGQRMNHQRKPRLGLVRLLPLPLEQLLKPPEPFKKTLSASRRVRGNLNKFLRYSWAVTL